MFELTFVIKKFPLKNFTFVAWFVTKKTTITISQVFKIVLSIFYIPTSVDCIVDTSLFAKIVYMVLISPAKKKLIQDYYILSQFRWEQGTGYILLIKNLFLEFLFHYIQSPTQRLSKLSPVLGLFFKIFISIMAFLFTIMVFNISQIFYNFFFIIVKQLMLMASIFWLWLQQ